MARDKLQIREFTFELETVGFSVSRNVTTDRRGNGVTLIYSFAQLRRACPAHIVSAMLALFHYGLQAQRRLARPDDSKYVPVTIFAKDTGCVDLLHHRVRKTDQYRLRVSPTTAAAFDVPAQEWQPVTKAMVGKPASLLDIALELRTLRPRAAKLPKSSG